MDAKAKGQTVDIVGSILQGMSANRVEDYALKEVSNSAESQGDSGTAAQNKKSDEMENQSHDNVNKNKQNGGAQAATSSHKSSSSSSATDSDSLRNKTRKSSSISSSKSKSSSSSSSKSKSNSCSRDCQERGEKSRNKDSQHSHRPSQSHRHSSNKHDHDDRDAKLTAIQEQLAALTSAMQFVTPFVTEIKQARDQWLEQESEEGEYSESEDEEPQTKKSKTVLEHDQSPEKSAENQSPPSILASMTKTVNQNEKTGPEVEEQLADIAKQFLEKGMNKEAFEKVLADILRPQNCDRLKVMRVNPSIFNNVSKEVKQEDIALQKVQRPLISGITKLVFLLDNLLKAEQNKIAAPSSQHVMTELSQAIGILCDTSHEVDLRRRWLFKPEMKEEYKSLCSEANPVTGELFGDQLSQSVKELQETNKVTSKLTKRSHKHGYGPYKQSSSSHRPHNAYSFLSEGHRGKYSRPKNYNVGHNRGSHSRGRPYNQNKNATKKQ